MKKEEFLLLLRRALTGDVPPQVVEENIRYYDNYISEEVRKGALEEDVIAEIGDPRLIARTIEDTTEGASQTGYTEPEEDRTGYSSGQYSDREQEKSSFGGGIHTFNLSKWYWKLLLMVVVVGFFYLVFMVVGGIFTILSPLLGPLLIIWIIMWIFKSNNRR